MDVKQLEINVNLNSLQPGFTNSELYYIIAESENKFRFADWNEEPTKSEEKFYCYLTEQRLFIPTGNIELQESYVLKSKSIYPVVANAADFIQLVNHAAKDNLTKGIRRFFDEEADIIKSALEERFKSVEKHLVKSRQGQHLLLLFDHMEASISATMIYLRHKTPASENHYKHIKETDMNDK